MERPRPLLLTAFLLLTLDANMARTAPPWEIACGDGRVDVILDDFDSPWDYCCSANDSIPVPVLHTIAGCHGNAMAVDYDLTNPPSGDSWIVLTKEIPSTNLSGYTHIRLALKGSNLNSHDSLDVKMRDAGGHLFAASLKSMTDLPEWRPIYLDFREFTGDGTLDLAHIVHLEIGIARCIACEVFDIPEVGAPEGHSGTLYLDEFAAVDLKPGAVNRLVETQFENVTRNDTVRGGAANALLARVAATGPGLNLVPAWFPEADSPISSPNFNSYGMAEALLVFIYEYELTGNAAFRTAANKLAAKLLSLQIPAGRQQSGAWYTAHTIQGGILTPPNRSIPKLNPPQCDGNEMMVADPNNPDRQVADNIDSCEWVGNVGWVMISLGRLKRAGFYDDATALTNALNRGADWIARQPSDRNDSSYPNLITHGIEGNISAYFGLLAAGRFSQAASLGDAVFQFGWDSVQRRMKAGVEQTGDATATAIDVAGSWGVAFLRSMGRLKEALDSQGYAASVMRTSSFNGSIHGYGDIAGPYTPAVEFTGQVVTAGIKDADFALQQMLTMQIPSGQPYAGAFPGSANHWYGGPLTPWNTTMAGVSPTAWVHFALSFDPLVDLLPFTDDPLTSGTTIKAAHVTELRDRIERARYRFGVGARSWTADPTIVSGSTTMKLQHLLDLRDALADAYHAANLPLPSFTPIAQGAVISTTPVTELRDAVKTLEAAAVRASQ